MQRELIFLLLLVYSFLLLYGIMVIAEKDSTMEHGIGAILNYGSTAGRQEKVAMEMAIKDSRNLTGHGLVLHLVDSRGDPVVAASAAMSLINVRHVQVIIGLRTWQEASFVAELGERAEVPILSFTSSLPPSASRQWPFFLRVVHNQRRQMAAIAAIIRSWHWKRVTLIYEDIDYTATSIIPHLADALRDTGSHIDFRLALPSFAAPLTEKLDILRSRQSRVFIVHTSIELAARLFAEANQMGMMATDYVWITTDAITGMLDHVNSSVIASMQGVLGVRNYFKPSAQITDFRIRFGRRYRSLYAEDESRDPRPSALIAYDAVWAVARAMNKTSPSGGLHNHSSSGDILNNQLSVLVSEDGRSLRDSILQSNFRGLSGEFYFENGEFAPTRAFQIVNVVGKSYRELGFWSYDFGFSVSLEKKEGSYETSMMILGQVFWPGGPWTVPKGWASPTSGNPLKIAVPAKAVFPEFVSVTYVSHNETLVEGFSINVFKETLKQLPYSLPYVFIPFNGTYDTLLEQDEMRTYDILVGDTSISAGRYRYVEFSQPYTTSGLVMVVPKRSDMTSKAWLFLKPFRGSMWLLTAVISVYNGIVVWVIERSCNPEFQGSPWHQFGMLFWLSFTTLLSPGEKLQNNLSRATMVVWLFVALVLTSNYTATLSSMLTARRLEPNIVSVESLKSTNAVVGCNKGSVVGNYLEEVLGFQSKNIKLFSSEADYYEAFKKGDIKAAFLRIPHAHLLVSKYCMELVSTGPIFNVGGLGFGVSQVFPKGSPLLTDISQAILEIFESGDLQRLEKALLDTYSCSSTQLDATDIDRLRPESFWALFFLTVGVSTFALVIYGLCFHKNELRWK